MFRLCDHREQFHSVVARNYPNHKQILNNNNFRHLKFNESFTGIVIKKASSKTTHGRFIFLHHR